MQQTKKTFVLVLFFGAKAKEVTSGLFGTLAKCVKNLNAKEDPTLIMDVQAELEKIDGEKKAGHTIVWTLLSRV